MRTGSGAEILSCSKATPAGPCMCGIAGFTGQAAPGVLQAMTSAIAHRGPDAQGVWNDDKVSLGHRRLSILDLSGGAQPMWAPDGLTGVVFNGEIYNHAELRSQLEASGAMFKSDHSDTEVLLWGYRLWGDSFVERLNGMWAFVIYDTQRRRLFGSRDRFGEKPLYYFHDGRTLVFASELRALAAHPAVPGECDPLSLARYFAHQYVPSPRTMLRNVWRLPGGHSFSYLLEDASLRIQQYWTLTFGEEPVSGKAGEDELAAELRARLRAAVARRLISDVPIGVFLSGGIDSSATAAFAAALAPGVKSFSIGFEEAAYDESVYAKEVAARLKTEHKSQLLSLGKAKELIPRILSRLDEPNADASILPTYLLCEFARRHVTVTLGGDGGDELFAGYDLFGSLQAGMPIHRFARPVLRLLGPLVREPGFPAMRGAGVERLFRAMRSWAEKEGHVAAAWAAPADAGIISRLIGRDFASEELFPEAAAAWEAAPGASLPDKTANYFVRLFLPDSVLAKVDRASMLNGLEVRAPFLDVEMAEFSRTLPASFKLKGRTTKYLLKRALTGMLPEHILHRKKKGFGIPIEAWMREVQFKPGGGAKTLIDCAYATDLWSAHARGQRRKGRLIWAIHVLSEWNKNRAAGGPPK